MSLEFTLCLISLFLFAGIGMPVAYAILLASLVYLFLGGQSIGIAGKTLMDGVYQSFILLAVPLFIVAANIMNAGTISDRLLRFCGKRDQYWKNPKTNTDARRLMADAERWLKREDVRQSAECQERLAPEVNALIHHVSFALSNSREEKDAACRAVEIGLPSGSSRRS